MSTDGQRIKWRRNIAENFNRLSRAHERYRQTTDRRAIAYSDRERKFTFAKNETIYCQNSHTTRKVHSSSFLTGRMVGDDQMYLKYWTKLIAAVPSKTPIFNRFSLVAPEP